MTTIQELELDCSDGAKLMIERMQTNPEDFRYGGKLVKVYRDVQLSARDKKATTAAHDKYITEPALMASMLQALLVQPEDEKESLKYKTQGKYGVGITDTQLFGMAQTKGEGQPVFDPLTDSFALSDTTRITRELYETNIQRHRELINAKATSVKQPGPSIAAQMYNKAFGRERIERDN